MRPEIFFIGDAASSVDTFEKPVDPAKCSPQVKLSVDGAAVAFDMFEEFGIRDSVEGESRVLSLMSQAVEAALQGFRAELEPLLAQQSAAMSALALRQASLEDAAAAQLERCAALELGLQTAAAVKASPRHKAGKGVSAGRRAPGGRACWSWRGPAGAGRAHRDTPELQG